MELARRALDNSQNSDVTYAFGDIPMSADRDRSKAKLWRERAEECRSVADGIKDETSRRQMMGVADSYDRMATLADERADAAQDRKPPIGDGAGT
jgi:hypothetical protein